MPKPWRPTSSATPGPGGGPRVRAAAPRPNGRDPLPAADQRMTRVSPDIRQVHGVDPVGDPVGAAHVLALHTRGGLALLLLAGLIQRPYRHAAGRRCRVKALYDVAADDPHHLTSVPGRLVQQPLDPVRAAVPDPLRDGPTVAFRQVGEDCPDVAGSGQPGLDPGEAATDAFHQDVDALIGPPGLHHQCSGCSWVLTCHRATIQERPPRCPPNRSRQRVDQQHPCSSPHEVRLPYRGGAFMRWKGNPLRHCLTASAELEKRPVFRIGQAFEERQGPLRGHKDRNRPASTAQG